MTDQAFREGVQAVVGELRAMRAVLEKFVPLDEPESVEMTCPHPLESRIDFGMTDGAPDFHCKDCGYRASEANEP